MAEEPEKAKPRLSERLHDAFTAAQVTAAVIGTPAMPVQQPHLNTPPTPPALVRRIERETSAPAQVNGHVDQAAEHLEQVNRQRRSRAMDQGQAESHPVAAQHPPRPRPNRDGRPGPERSRSRDR